MVVWQIDNNGAAGWNAQVEALAGGFYQCHEWGEIRRSAGWTPLRVTARRNGQLVTAASLLVKRKAGVSVVWVPGGPAGEVETLDRAFTQHLREWLGTPLHYIRISLLRSAAGREAESLVSEGWRRPRTPMSSGQSMAYALEGDEGARLQRASGNWRHNLKRASRYGLRIEPWSNPDIDAICALYREMEALKSIPVQHSKAELEQMFSLLGDRLVLYRCLDGDGRLLALRAAGVLGDTAMDLLAAAGAAARKLYASHATLWALLDDCSRRGLLVYDLSGVDPEGNKGVYDFKHGTGASLVTCLGEWEWASAPGLCLGINMLLARKAKTPRVRPLERQVENV